MAGIQHIIKKLMSVDSVQLLRNSDLLPYPDDIDVYASMVDINTIVDILLGANLVVTHSSDSKLQAKGYIDDDFYIIDILFKCNYITEHFCDVYPSKELESEIKQDSGLGRFLRYVYMLRREQRYIKFVDAHYEEYKDALVDAKYTTRQVFKSLPSRRQLRLIMLRKPITLIKHIGVRLLLCTMLFKLRVVISRLGRGRIYAIIGPDGSGKSTVLNHLNKFGVFKSMYMGDRQFLLQPVYDFFLSHNWRLFGLIFIPMYIEQWLRYLYARSLNLLGTDVVVDRYAGLNGIVSGNRAYKILYAIFPQADVYILLNVLAEDVIGRKSELSLLDVKAYYKAISEMQLEYKLYVVNNTDLSICVNNVAGIIFSDL